MRRTTLFLLALAPALLVAQTGVAFLKIPVGARVCGIGEAAAAYVDDVSALYYNPAGLARIRSLSVLAMHNEWLLDMNHEYVGAGFGTEELGTFGLAFNYWGSGPLQGLTWRGETIPGYVFSATDWCLNLGYGRQFSDFSVGLGAKFISERHESLSTSAWAFDAGAMYQTPLRGLKVGLSAENIGTKLRLDQEQYSLPWSARLGWRYDLSIFGVTQDFILSGTEKPGIAVGAECRPVDILALRLGYRTGSGTAGFGYLRAGLGISYRGFGVDYAFAPYGKLGMTHRISVSYRGGSVAADEE